MLAYDGCDMLAFVPIKTSGMLTILHFTNASLYVVKRQVTDLVLEVVPIHLDSTPPVRRKDGSLCMPLRRCYGVVRSPSLGNFRLASG